MNHALRAGGAVAGIALSTAFGALVAGAGAQDAAACARPNVPATVIRAVTPDAPALAQQQGISGTVQVVVSLDQGSRVVGTRIQSSPNAVLNSAALAAARQSAYRTEIRNCMPIASDVIVTMQFDNGIGSATAPQTVDRRPIAVVSAVGIATRAPDVAYVSAGILTDDDAAPVAAAKNDAIYTALRANLKALGIGDASIRNAYFGMTFVPRPTPAPSPPPDVLTPAPSLSRGTPATQRYGYVANREVTASIADVSKASSVVSAMLAAGVTSISSVLFSLNDRRAAYDEALAAALKDAAGQAEAVATASRMHVAGIRQIEVGQNLLGPATPAPNQPLIFVNSPAAMSLGNVHPLPVEVRASVTVTYILKP